jgi:(4-O-methyl)-D-glucuronate---lignin esterase
MASGRTRTALVSASILLMPLALACSSDPEAGVAPPPFAGEMPAPTNQDPGVTDPSTPSPDPSNTPVTGGGDTQNPTDLAGGDDMQPPAGEGDGSDEGETGEEPPTDVPTVPLVGVEDSGVDCARPNLPAANQLPNVAAHPDPFLMTNGTRISTKAEWTCRRAEIKAQVEEYESGPKPVVDKANVTGAFANNVLTVGVSEQGRQISFDVTINRPSGAQGAIPLLIGIGGSSLDNSVFSQNGVASTNLNNNAMGAQAGGGSRGTGIFYDLYGNNNPASSMIAWAWGVSRIIDALEKTPEANIDPARIAVTGCSRNGKGALTAGAFDERVALTIPQESGAGGSASWRVSQAGSNGGENVQTLQSAAGEQPWFRANFGQNFSNGNVTRLPFDHHSVMGMVAPRALLVIDNRIDWLGIDSTFTAGSIASEIWQALGIGDRMGYWQTTGHTHCAFPGEQRAALEAYVQKFLVGGGTGDTNLLRGDQANADLARWQTWQTPTLQ